MTIEAFSVKWFTLYYLALGTLAGSAGLYFLVKTRHFKKYLQVYADSDHPPPAIRMVLKYFLLFTIPAAILSFFPFSWIELFFSVWSLLFVYVVGLQLVRWEQLHPFLKSKNHKLRIYIRYGGAMMLAVSVVMFLLSYLVILRSDLL